MMNASNLFFVFWRKWLWFWVIMGLFIFTPVTLIVIRSQKTYWIFHTFCKYWCRLVLLLNGFWSYTKFKSLISSNSAYIICPNHTSKFDIILLFATFPTTFVFMGKKNVSKIPFFEWFYNNTMITFDRDNISSAVTAYRKADRLLKAKISIVIFPEGAVPKNNVRLAQFRLGAFKLAIHNQVSIIPITFVDNKRKYPEDKLKLILGVLRVFVHEPISTIDMKSKEAESLCQTTYDIINKTLIKYDTK